MEKKTRAVFIGGVQVGGGAPVVIQSMTNTKTSDIEKTCAQISRLVQNGCELVRVAVPDEESVQALPGILGETPIPVIADIHFDYRLALSSIAAGVHGIRINPGNIGSPDRVEAIIKAARENNIPIRIGVNSGSLPEGKIKKFGSPGAEAMVETLVDYVRFFEERDFFNLKLSVKSTSVLETIVANREVSNHFPYPIHLGLTEAGTLRRGLVNSVACLAPLLLEGIGDTIRISLTEDPVQEVRAAWDLLRAVGLRWRGLNIYSCPTCGRCEIELEKMVKEIEKATEGIQKDLNIAVMGCAVNGPGEAKEADLGLAGGRGFGVIFSKGKPLGTFPADKLIRVFVEKIKEFPG